MIRVLTLVLAATLATASPAPAASSDLSDRLEMLAQQGNAEALYHLGMIAHLGLDGAEPDAAKALTLFRQSAEKGDPLGAYKLGCFYAGQGGDVLEPNAELALKYKLVAAEAGYALAQNDVALIYFQNGETDTALRWLRRAADQGDFGSMMAFSALHSGEMGIPKDGAAQYAYVKLAMQKFEKADEKLPAGWDAELRGQFSADELLRGDEIVASWTARPTPLTLKANAGHQAANDLVAVSN